MDRRLALRVPIERPIRVWNRLHRLEASLVDLSVSSCRLLCREPVTAGRVLWIWLPSGLGGSMPHPIRGDVIWAESVPGEPTGVCHVAIEFRPILASTHARLHAALRSLLRHDGERRASERTPYGRRVITRGAGRPRVLIGRDLSSGGMRVADGDGLEIGAEVQIALHAGGAIPPLVVEARVVHQEHGEAGLQFLGLDDARREHLHKLIHDHTGLMGRDGQPAVVGEIVDPAS